MGFLYVFYQGVFGPTKTSFPPRQLFSPVRIPLLNNACAYIINSLSSKYLDQLCFFLIDLARESKLILRSNSFKSFSE